MAHDFQRTQYEARWKYNALQRRQTTTWIDKCLFSHPSCASTPQKCSLQRQQVVRSYHAFDISFGHFMTKPSKLQKTIEWIMITWHARVHPEPKLLDTMRKRQGVRYTETTLRVNRSKERQMNWSWNTTYLRRSVSVYVLQAANDLGVITAGQIASVHLGNSIKKSIILGT